MIHSTDCTSTVRDRISPSKVPSGHHAAGFSLWKHISCFSSTTGRRNLKTEFFTLKTHELFFVHTTPKEFKNAIKAGHFGFDTIVFVKLRFQNVFRPHEKEKPAFSNSSGLKICVVFVLKVDLIGEIKLRFQNSTALCGHCLYLLKVKGILLKHWSTFQLLFGFLDRV